MVQRLLIIDYEGTQAVAQILDPNYLLGGVYHSVLNDGLSTCTYAHPVPKVFSNIETISLRAVASGSHEQWYWSMDGSDYQAVLHTLACLLKPKHLCVLPSHLSPTLAEPYFLSHFLNDVAPCSSNWPLETITGHDIFPWDPRCVASTLKSVRLILSPCACELNATYFEHPDDCQHRLREMINIIFTKSPYDVNPIRIDEPLPIRRMEVVNLACLPKDTFTVEGLVGIKHWADRFDRDLMYDFYRNQVRPGFVDAADWIKNSFCVTSREEAGGGVCCDKK